MQPLTHERIDEGIDALVHNAVNLLEEADLLVGHGYRSRAFSLAVLACEEVSKINAAP
jgi:AbiV family abortive infection protein